MPIFRRRMFAIFSAISLLLCVAILALWLPSYFWQLSAEHFTRNNYWILFGSEGGDLSCYGYGRFMRPGQDSDFSLHVPHYQAALATALLPAIWMIVHRFRRPEPGLCPICGYDLRATPARCPECGTPWRR